LIFSAVIPGRDVSERTRNPVQEKVFALDSGFGASRRPGMTVGKSRE
jgi:hypothetical protein